MLNFHRLAPRLNHLSLYQLKRNFKILLANLLHIVKKAVVLKLITCRQAVVLIVVVKCYRLTHDEITSNVNRNQVD